MTKIGSIHSWVEKNKIRKYTMICRKPRKRHLQQSNFSKGLTKLAILPGCSPRMLFYLIANCKTWTF